MNRHPPPKRFFLGALGLVSAFCLWETLVWTKLLPPGFVPYLSAIPGELWTEIRSGVWHQTILASLSHYTVGLGVGSLLGIGFGLVAATRPTFDALQHWLVRLLEPIPPLAWIPIATLWFGISTFAASVIVIIEVFWINYFCSYNAVRAVNPQHLEVARAFGQQGYLSLLLKVLLPGASADIADGLRRGVRQGWMTLVAVELLGIPGIGQRMNEAAGLLATEVVVIYMLTIALFYAGSDRLFMLMQRRLLRWHS